MRLPKDVAPVSTVEALHVPKRITSFGNSVLHSPTPVYSYKYEGSSNLHRVQIGRATLYLGDCAEVLPRLSEIDACVTDPPYGLGFMGKAWDQEVPQADVWEMVLSTLKEGAHLLSFSSARTYHRLACQVEDAGFDIRDQIMWVYGSGFPKSHDVGKGIEALFATGESGAKAQRITAMGESYEPTSGAGIQGYRNAGSIFGEHRFKGPGHQLKLSSSDARTWSGWGTNLKPAHEPIVLARKKFVGSVARNVLEHGTGALNIDQCRVGSSGGTYRSHQADYPVNDDGKTQRDHWARSGHNVLSADVGRWPANLITDGSAEVAALFPYVRTSAGGKRRKDSGSVNAYGKGIGDKAGVTSIGYDEAGSAMRFFYCAKASSKDRNEGLEDVERDGQTTRRNNHPTVKPSDLMAYLCRLITPVGGMVLDPFMGSGSTGKAALMQGFRFTGIERDPSSFDIACARIAAIQGIM